VFSTNYASRWGAGEEIPGSRSKVPLLFIIFFFTVFSIEIYSIWIPLSVVAGFLLYLGLYYRHFFRFVSKNWVVLLFPAVVLLSATWSSDRSQTFYYGLQLCITLAIGVLMGILTTQRQFVLGIFIAATIITIASIWSGRMGPSAAGPVLIGVTGSKDQMGFAGLTLFASGMGVLFDRGQARVLRLAALSLLPVGAYIATHVESATPMIGAAGFAVAFPGLFALRYIRKKARWAVVLMTLVLIPPLVLVVVSIIPSDITQQILTELGKDETLTGRTIIWDKADYWIQNSPIIGYGYRSFWMGDSADAVGLLHYFGLTDGRFFQFHDTYREILVDTGLVGLLSFLSVAAIFAVNVIADLFTDPGAPSAFIASMFLFVFARSQVETIILIFYPYTAVLYACGASAIVYFMREKIRAGSAQSASQTAMLASPKAGLGPFRSLR
jgi:exopolysaccharide production protein ExoQ